MFWRYSAIVLLCLCLCASVEAAERRLALIMANQDYPAAIGRLTNTHADAATVAAALEQTGFEVTIVLDADEDGMEEAIFAFEQAINAEAADGDDVIGFFYASMHGAAAEVNGRTRNFLLPAKEDIQSVSQLVRTGIRMDELLQGFALTDATAMLVISDACRNEMATSFTKSTTKGFVPEPSGPGMLVAYATAPGSTTPDDGLFAKTLAEEIVKPGRRGTIAMVDAIDRISVRRSFDGQPYFNPGGLPEWFCFSACTAPITAPAVTPLSRAEILDLQIKLNLLGYEIGAPTGTLTAATEAIISGRVEDLGAAITPEEDASAQQRWLYEHLNEAIAFGEYAPLLVNHAAFEAGPLYDPAHMPGPYAVRKGEFCEDTLVYSDASGLKTEIRVDSGGCWLWLRGVGDYDGDGVLDALIETNPGGAATPSSFHFVSPGRAGGFQVSKAMGAVWQDDYDLSLTDAGWALAVRSLTGNGADAVTESYIWKKGVAVLVEGGQSQPLISDAALTYAVGTPQELMFDLNGDGLDERIGCEPWDRWSVLICEISDGASGTALNDVYEVQGGRIGVLSTQTDGWRDLVTGDNTIVRWTGKGYGAFGQE